MHHKIVTSFAAGLTVLLIWFGVYPAPLLGVIQAAVGSLT